MPPPYNCVTNVLDTADVDTWYPSTVAPVVADNTARDALFPSPVTNQRVFNQADGEYQIYEGTAWVSHIPINPATVLGGGRVVNTLTAFIQNNTTRVSVLDFIDVSTGETIDDDFREILQRAIDNSPGKTVVIPPRNTPYILKNPSFSERVIDLPHSVTLDGVELGQTTIKMDDSAARYWTMIGNASASSFADVAIINLVLDGNGTGNPPEENDSLVDSQNYRMAIFLQGTITRPRVEKCRFTDFTCVNTVTINGTITDVLLADLYCDNIGRTDSGYNDHSTFYIAADRITARNINCRGRAENTGGQSCAFELHADQQNVDGLNVDLYELGAWSSGARSCGKISNQSVWKSIRMRRVKNGIRVFSFDTTVGGFGTPDLILVNGLLIDGFDIQIDRDVFDYAVNSRFSLWSYGVGIWHGSDRSIKNISFSNGVIKFDAFTSALDPLNTYANYSNGITMVVPGQLCGLTIEDVSVTNVTVVNSPSAGMVVLGAREGFKRLFINGLTVINPGQDSTRGANYRSPLLIGGTACDYSRVVNVAGIDDQSVPTMATGVNLLSTTAIQSELLDPFVRIGTTNIASVVTTSADANASWFIRTRHRGSSAPSFWARYGSTVSLENGGAIYEQRAINAGTSWIRIDSAMSANNGDSSPTLTPASAPVQYFGTTLTADRTITLPTGSKDMEFEVFRTAGGAYTLAVGSVVTGPKATPFYAKVKHDGAAWRLIAYSPLSTGITGTDSTLGFYGGEPVSQAPLVPDPTGGTTVDAEARAAVVSILTVLKNINLIASS